MKHMNNSNKLTSPGYNLPATKNDSPPMVGSLDYYIYARNFPHIKKFLDPDGDMRAFDKQLKDLLDKTVIDLGHAKAHLSLAHQTALLGSLRSEVFNYFSNYSIEDLKLCFHNGIRDKYGSVQSLSIATIHKWIEGFKLDEDRILAIKSEEAKKDMLRQQLEDQKKMEPKLKYIQLYFGLLSCIDQFYAIGDAGKLAWVYYDEFVRFGVLDIPYETRLMFMEKAKELSNVKTKEVEGVYAKKILIENKIEATVLTIEREAKRLGFELFINQCFTKNLSPLTIYENINLEELYKMDHPENDLFQWESFYIGIIKSSYEDYLNTRNIRGFHSVIYNWLLKGGHIEKVITNIEKETAIIQAQEEVYETFSKYKSTSKTVISNQIFEQTKNSPENSPQVKYEAKFIILKLFFQRVKEQNLILDNFLHGTNKEK